MRKELTLEQQKEGMNFLREKLGIKGKTLSEEENGRRRVKCSEAEFFPEPPSFWKESRINVYQLLSEEAEDYIRCWDFNGLHVLTSGIQ